MTALHHHTDAAVHGDVQKQKREERKERKRKAPDAGTSEGRASEAWAGSHPWRPFDRDKDLQQAPKKVTSQDLLKKAGSLAGRFASG